jgi:PhnB protein
MVLITPNFQFSGNCEDAIHFYEKAFDTKVDFILHYSDAKREDWNIELTEKEKTYVYHAEMKIGIQRIMFADVITFEINKGNSLFLTVTFETKENVEKAFNVLKDEGKILIPLRKTTYSSCIGTLIDKYGIRWGLMTEQTER